MNILGSFIIAFSMYSKIPMPRLDWTESRMRYVMCFFPLIGMVIGVLLWLFLLAAQAFSLGPAAQYAGGVLLPLIVTGGIHMDGYLDVTDAKSSYGEPEKKLQILKDPHVGAFAVIGCGIYLLLYLAVFSELPLQQVPAAGAVYVMTRAMSGLSVVIFPKAKKNGLAAAFSHGAQKKIVIITMLLYIAACLCFLGIFSGITTMAACIVSGAAVYAWYYKTAVKEFGGMTGDLAGWFLQNSELVLLAAIAITTR